ncbi:MAG: sugar phosphate isomerase/epimerase, partial [Phycisphaerae bacterium]|nr:sugar phosphate isomerase/epimerase [Phycisphaerae bacterium]
KGLQGDALKAAVRTFVEQLKPHVAVAEELNVTIGIENHDNSLIESPDSMRWFAEFAASKHVGIALAPYHLPQDPEVIGKLIEALGPKLVQFYAWQHGKGCREKLPKAEELLQMPGRGSMDFTPIVAALKRIRYTGWTEIFMHPVPRGVPILETPAEVTAEINRARTYLDRCIEKIA